MEQSGVKTTGWSKIPGELGGVKMDTSKWPEMSIFVVLPISLSYLWCNSQETPSQNCSFIYGLHTFTKNHSGTFAVFRCKMTIFKRVKH